MTGCRFPRGRIRHSRFRRNAGFWFVVFIRLFSNYSAVLRLCAAGISRDSLYLAMVRRETSMPRKASRLASASSEYGVGVDEAKPAAGKGLSEAMRSSAASSVPLSVWGRCFLFVRGFGCGCRQCCRGRFGRYAGRRVWQHIRPIFLSAVSAIRSNRRRPRLPGRIFSMRSARVAALLHPTSTLRAYGRGCLRCCRSDNPARQGNR